MQQFLEYFLLPPGINIVFFALVPIIWRFGRRAALFTFYFSLGALWLISTPLIARILIGAIQYYPPLEDDFNNAQLIVTLGSGIYQEAPEYAGVDTVSRGSLERLRYTYLLYQKTGLPILLAGGKPDIEHTPEAVTMNQVLIDEYNIAPQWLETTSVSTIENAQMVSTLLKKEKLHSIILVTHAFHMNRAKWSFEQYGITVLPAPMGYFSESTSYTIKEVLPSAKALNTSNQALKEIIGLTVYKLLYAR